MSLRLSPGSSSFISNHPNNLPYNPVGIARAFEDGWGEDNPVGIARAFEDGWGEVVHDFVGCSQNGPTK